VHIHAGRANVFNALNDMQRDRHLASGGLCREAKAAERLCL
jgi:hypothetical protein